MANRKGIPAALKTAKRTKRIIFGIYMEKQ